MILKIATTSGEIEYKKIKYAYINTEKTRMDIIYLDGTYEILRLDPSNINRVFSEIWVGEDLVYAKKQFTERIKK